MINKFVLEPSVENLERLKRTQGNQIYWHTADFFQFERRFQADFSSILEAYTEALLASDDEDNEDEIIRKIEFATARKLVKEARKAGISSQDYRDQLNNYTTVIWTPICIWSKDQSGKITYSLMSNLRAEQM